ncbi:S-adenosylmethionine-dependent methyltransferase [Echinicola pacifica]|uniref:S-adenosylmethionine-dependent methyltransferase n=1 Tax=Echinicola pacifica TaxID=346377 RepID=A0A918PU40_9BACT|nr:SAM-dependent methyltransferase [Echinicola pacifica]GGZ22866.1 S-adenosylmethionine-dependent methyltransferase [Echinicola pacifica]
MKKGKLFLIPTSLAEGTSQSIISPQVKEVITNTEYFLAENLRTGRRFVSGLRLGLTIENLSFEILDKKTKPAQLDILMKPLHQGHDMGVMSEAGCPGIADPGAAAVAYAHQKGIQVIPLSGPSSMFLALMGSGFNGQSFAFHGYLPIDKKSRGEAIKKIEAESTAYRRSQIFMETPFRNNHLFESLMMHLHPNTKLCVASNLTAADEFILTKPVSEWKKMKIDLHKIPTVFVLDTNY